MPTRIEYGENDHCCARFKLVGAWLADGGQEVQGTVGGASARLLRSRAVVDAVVPRLREDPLVFLHDRGTGCGECDEAWSSLD